MKLINIFILVCFYLFSTQAKAQTSLLVDSSAFSISSGTLLYVNGDFKLDNNATLDLPLGSLLEVNGNWTNTNNTTKELKGTVSLVGLNRSINDDFSVFEELFLDNATGTIKMLSNITIDTLGFLSLGAVKLDLNKNTLIVKNPMTFAVSRTTGHIISEDQTSTLEWSLKNSSTGDVYVLPFGDKASKYLPVTIEINTPGSSDGLMSVWTYRTDDNASPNNRPLPSGVGHLNGASGENATKVLDRFWKIEFDGFATLPDVHAILSYDDDEWNTANSSTNSITESDMQAQLWGSNKWGNLQGSVNVANNTLDIPNANSTTGSGIWTLVDDSSPLPIELVSLQAKLLSSKQVILHWETNTEINNYGFEIQKSSDAINWKSIGFVEGKGTSYSRNKYNFIDKNPFLGFNYYRLKQIDFDEKIEFSKIVNANLVEEGKINIYPNPTTGMLHITADNKSVIKIYDTLGRMLKEQSLTNQSIDVSDLTNGVYLVSIATKDTIITRRIIKE